MTNEPLSFANVVLYCESQLVGFKNTDTLGRFSIEIDPEQQSNSCDLHITMLGYSDKVIALHNDAGRVILMSSITNHLETIEIKARKRGMIERGDTTIYDADFYAHGLEESAKEIIEKLPGINIDEDGAIYAEGKHVDKLLIEGDEFADNQRRRILEGLKAGDIAEVELIRNYSDNHQLLHDRRERGLALNLKLKDTEKDRLHTELILAYGLHKSRDLQATSYSITKKKKLFAHLENGNTKDHILSVADYIGFQSEHSRRRLQQEFVAKQIPLVFRQGNVYSDFNATSMTASYSVESENGRSQALNAILYRPSYTSHYMEENYVWPEGKIITNMRKNDGQDGVYDLQYDLDHRISNRSMLLIESGAQILKHKTYDAINSVLLQSENTFLWDEKDQRIDGSLRAEYKYKVNKNALLSIAHLLEIKDRTNGIVTVDSDMGDRQDQRILFGLLDNTTKISYLQTKEKNDMGIDLLWNYTNIENREELLNLHSSQDRRLLATQFYYGIFSRRIDVKAQLKLASVGTTINAVSNHTIMVLPDMKLSYRFTPYIQLEIQYVEDTQVNVSPLPVNATLLEDPNLVYRYNLAGQPIGQTRKFDQRLIYRNTRLGLSCIPLLVWQRSTGFLYQSMVADHQISQQITNGAIDRSMKVGVFFNWDWYRKFLGFRGYLLRTQGDTNVSVSHPDIQNSYTAVQQQLNFFTRWKSHINLEVKQAIQLYSFGREDFNQQSKMFQMHSKLLIAFPQKKIKWNVSNGFQLFRQTDQQDVSRYILSTELTYKSNNGISLSFVIEDLFHLDQFVSYRYQQFDNVNILSSQQSLGGYAMFRLSYDF